MDFFLNCYLNSYVTFFLVFCQIYDVCYEEIYDCNEIRNEYKLAMHKYKKIILLKKTFGLNEQKTIFYYMIYMT